MERLTRGDVAMFFELAERIANEMLRQRDSRRPGSNKTLLMAVRNGDATLDVRAVAPASEVRFFASVRGCEPELIGRIKPGENVRLMRIN